MELRLACTKPSIYTLLPKEDLYWGNVSQGTCTSCWEGPGSPAKPSISRTAHLLQSSTCNPVVQGAITLCSLQNFCHDVAKPTTDKPVVAFLKSCTVKYHTSLILVVVKAKQGQMLYSSLWRKIQILYCINNHGLRLLKSKVLQSNFFVASLWLMMDKIFSDWVINSEEDQLIITPCALLPGKIGSSFNWQVYKSDWSWAQSVGL